MLDFTEKIMLLITKPSTSNITSIATITQPQSYYQYNDDIEIHAAYTLSWLIKRPVYNSIKLIINYEHVRIK